ncbi:hypothetical protein, partial [Stenotrophomonas sp. SY1]|uniref:hypothetical protein n=1 Tax=Stenotrophomonas sp. SY1 TaxID=477235 RepID=UPI001E40369A
PRSHCCFRRGAACHLAMFDCDGSCGGNNSSFAAYAAPKKQGHRRSDFSREAIAASDVVRPAIWQCLIATVPAAETTPASRLTPLLQKQGHRRSGFSREATAASDVVRLAI